MCVHAHCKFGAITQGKIIRTANNKEVEKAVVVVHGGYISTVATIFKGFAATNKQHYVDVFRYIMI
jgi:hypothetical protein